ncbi:MAG: tRNA lysidine(34) synthetase TilS [Thermoleophilia bacterium]|nr:tRNA lysidine(34) synthetase TilS [Thermoleophilia bacterium]
MSDGRGQVRAFERRVCDFVAAREVLRPGERPLVLLSGGPDSMCLLHLLPIVDRRLSLGLRAAALHVDYGLRGSASDRDRHLVEQACAAAGLTLHVERLEGSLRGPDFQARARVQRYALARQLARRFGYGPLVTAHNRDDQAETVLYRLVKYASPLGLAGMRAREDDVARPLLGAGADEIRAYCAACDIAYGQDASNLEPVYARNALRLEVLPALARLNPRVGETLADAAAMAAAEGEVVAAALDGAWERVRTTPRHGEIAALELAALAAEPPALRALCLRRLAAVGLPAGALVTRRQVAALQGLAGRPAGAGRAALRGGREAVRESGRLAVRPVPAAHACAPVEVSVAAPPSSSATPPASCAAVFCRWGAAATILPGAHPPEAYRAALRQAEARPPGVAPALARPPEPSPPSPAAVGAGGDERRLSVGFAAPPRVLTLRHPRRGERFTPFGRVAATTVARFLAGAGCGRDERRRALVLEVDGALAAVAFVDRAGALRSRVAHERRVTQSTEWTLSVALEER